MLLRSKKLESQRGIRMLGSDTTPLMTAIEQIQQDTDDATELTLIQDSRSQIVLDLLYAIEGQLALITGANMVDSFDRGEA